MIQAVAGLLRTSFAVATAYRASFWSEAGMALAWSAWTAFPLLVVFGQSPVIAGWTMQEGLLVVGFFVVMEGLLDAFVDPNLRAVVEHVRQGTLDFILLKPVDAQLMISLHRTNPTKIPHIFVGLGIVAWASRDLHPSPAAVGLAALLLLAGVAILHALWTFVVCTTFWFVRVDNLSFLVRAVLDAGRWPLGFYKGAARVILTVVVPVGLMTTWPALALRGLLGAQEVAMALGVAGAFTLGARLAWVTALRRYSSASS